MGEVHALGERVGQIRRRRSMTQAELADKAGVGVDLVHKVEQGRSVAVRILFLHQLARALEVPTATLFELEDSVDNQDQTLLPLRRLLLPVPGDLAMDEPDLSLPSLQSRLSRAAQEYHRANYQNLINTMPDLVKNIGATLDIGTDENQEATYRLLANTYIVIASTLIQLRSEDLACEAIRRATEAAQACGDDVLRAAATDRYRWALVRQGRFDDAESVAVRTADEIEPSMTKSSPDHLAVWGRLLNGASGAAARNNRPEAAKELLTLAQTAAARIVADRMDYGAYWSAFGPGTVAAMATENAMTVGDAPEALRLAHSVKVNDKMPMSTWTRHLLAVAEAYTATRDYTDAIRTVQSARKLTPEWLRNQPLAHHIITDLLDSVSVRKAKQSGLADLASFVGVQP